VSTATPTSAPGPGDRTAELRKYEEKGPRISAGMNPTLHDTNHR
jgi:hypothetical protein